VGSSSFHPPLTEMRGLGFTSAGLFCLSDQKDDAGAARVQGRDALKIKTKFESGFKS